jgi:uncharacterized membrane protein
VAPAAIVAAGAVLRFATLGDQSFWLDEAATAHLVRDDLGGLLTGVVEREATPPLYYVLAWLWAQVAGAGETGLRSLSALLGTLAIPAALALGDRLAGRRAGLAAAALVAFNPFLVWFSQEARAYALLVLLTTCASLSWLRAMTGRDARAALAWGALGALSLLAHYFALFLLVPQAALLLWRGAAGRRAAAAGIAVVGVAGLALLPLVLAQRDARVTWVADSALAGRLVDVPKHWAAGPFGSPVDAAVALVALALAAAGALALVRLTGAARRGAVLLAGAALAGIALPALAAAAGFDYVLDRYLLASLVPLLAVAGAGLAALPAAGAATATVCAAFLAFTVTWMADPELQREDWREVAARAEAAGAGTPVVAPAEAADPLLVYLPGRRRSTEPVLARDVVYVAPWRFGERRPATPPPPAPAFQLAARDELPTATLVRFRAPAPTRLDAASFGAHTLTPGEPVSVLLPADAGRR